MKKLALVVLLLIGASALDLTVTKISTEPVSINAGDRNVKITVTLLNNNPGENYEELTVKLGESGPFTAAFTGSMEAPLTIPSLAEVSVEFFVNVVDNAVVQWYQLPLSVMEGSNVKNEFEVSVPVRGEIVLEVEGLRISPSKITPGSTVTLTGYLTNNGQAMARSIDAFLRLNPPFSSTLSQKEHISSLQPTKTSLLTYTFDVDKSAQGQVYPLNLELTYSDETGQPQSSVIQFNLAVVGECTPVVQKVTTDPRIIVAGDTVNVGVEIKNSGSAGCESASAILSSSFPFNFTGGETASSKILGTISKSESQTVNFRLIISKDAEAGNYNLPLTINYTENQMNKITLLQVPMEVHLQPRFEVVSMNTTPEELVGGTDATFTIAVKNVGTDDAEAVVVGVKSSWPFSSSGSNIYIGDLRRGETKSGSLKIEIDKNALIQKYKLELSVDYKDSSKVSQTELISTSAEVKYSGPFQRLVMNIDLIAVLLLLGVVTVTMVLFMARLRAQIPTYEHIDRYLHSVCLVPFEPGKITPDGQLAELQKKLGKYGVAVANAVEKKFFEESAKSEPISKVIIDIDKIIEKAKEELIEGLEKKEAEKAKKELENIEPADLIEYITESFFVHLKGLEK